MSLHHLHGRLDALDHGGQRPVLVICKRPSGMFTLPNGEWVDSDGLRAYELRHGVTRTIIDDILYLEDSEEKRNGA